VNNSAELDKMHHSLEK